MIRPAELKDDDVWGMLTACRDGDLDRATALLRHRRELVGCEYNYTPPIHFAVGEAHLDIVPLLRERGAEAGAYPTYPFQDSLLAMAEDREYR